ncbi:YciI family protein [Tenacibaculum singaporense]|uniref:YciI family protein n=1 Tax=Tenacibaculum singaporense TaxID=2358479 RepID=UPI000F6737C4|nr:YciI family protein [Tenacibaculum singaporense]RSC93483.1 hypothetical protein EI424_09740 [Tenacibaculum singaporense]
MERIFMTLKYSPGKNWQKGKPISKQNLHSHRMYHQELLEKGKILIGGAFIKTDEGINILRVNNREEAVAIAEKDPAVKDKILQVEIQPLYVVFKSADAEQLDMKII